MGELSEGQRLVLAAAEDILAGASVCVLQPAPAAEPSDRRADPGMLLQPDMAAGTHNRVVLGTSVTFTLNPVSGSCLLPMLMASVCLTL